MCGVVGVVCKTPVNQLLFDTLSVLQHRGQDAAGIMTAENGKFYLRKSNGLVKDVFHTRHMKRLIGNIGIAHVRYPTSGSSTKSEAQPFYVNSPYGIALAHNGNLTNTNQLTEELYKSDLRHINTKSDSEVLLNVFAHELSKEGHNLTEEGIFSAIAALHKRCSGAYALVMMINGKGIVATRDINGIRPLVLGFKDTDLGREYMVASETVALDSVGFSLLRDVEAGEAVYISEDGQLHTKICAKNTKNAPCLFEYVYFARPDSTLSGINVYHSRMKMGTKLAERVRELVSENDIDVVMPIPDTSRTIALELAQQLGLLYREGFIKNRYIGRTFIMPGQKMRKKSVRQKLNVIASEFKGKNVLLIDDSIVRGTTSKQIVQLARDAGARKVYFASAAPPVRYPNVYGIDMPSKQELIAHERSEEEMQEFIGVDKLIFQKLADLKAACNEINPNIKDFEASVFDGFYITGDIDDKYLENQAKRHLKKTPVKNKGIENID